MGLNAPEPAPAATSLKPLQAAGARPPRLLMPGASDADHDASALNNAVAALKDALGRVATALAPAN
jgi:hypothetical protein